MQVVLLILLV